MAENHDNPDSSIKCAEQIINTFPLLTQSMSGNSFNFEIVKFLNWIIGFDGDVDSGLVKVWPG